jgi:hypothetical protein
MAHERIISLYEEHAAGFDAQRDRDLFELLWLERFCALIPPGGEDPWTWVAAWASRSRRGCCRAGFEVTGVDSSPLADRTVPARFPGSHGVASCPICARLNSATVSTGLLAWLSFFHLSPSDQRPMFERFAAHLAPGGALMFTSGQNEGEAIGEWQGEPLYRKPRQFGVPHTACRERIRNHRSRRQRPGLRLRDDLARAQIRGGRQRMKQAYHDCQSSRRAAGGGLAGTSGHRRARTGQFPVRRAGELPAGELLRVWVDDEDMARAKTLLAARARGGRGHRRRLPGSAAGTILVAAAWQGLCAAGAGTALRDELLAAWTQPQRHYHTLRHLRDCLALLEPELNLAEHPAKLKSRCGSTTRFTIRRRRTTNRQRKLGRGRA